MAGLPTTARVVIIGGGVVGCSSLYHLCKAGWTDCVLLEKNELTSGSTWHAAGNVPTFSSSWSLMNMQRYSTELYRGLAEAVDYPMNYHVTGSLRLAHTKERMQEFQRAKGMGRYQGMDIDVVGLDEIKRRYPFIETHELKGALYDPSDGDIDPAQLTQALAKGARDMGAKIIRFCPVSGVRRENGEWVVETPQGEIRCEIVINAAGYRAAEVGKMFGRDVPMMVMSHQYILFEEIPELAAWTKEQGHKLPLLRDVDTSYYLRQEKSGMNLGPYERNCRAHWATHNDPMPEDFSFQLFPDDLDRLEHYLADAVARVPILGTAGLSKVINGPIPYAPDGNPLIGPMPGVPNAFEACVFTFGIAQGGGAGKVLAEWVTGGQTEWDMWSCDPRRFTSFASALDYCAAKGMEIYGNEYAIQFPRHAWPEGRNRKLSPLHERVKALGGQFDAYNGWERATWYARPGDDTSEEATLTFRRDGPWQRAVREECLAVRDAAGILDLPGFSRFNLEGPGAAEWLALQVTGLVPKPGRIGLVYFSDDKGRIVTEMSVVRHREDLMTLITAAVAQWHDFEWLKSRMPADAAFTLTDRTEEYSTQILAGPNSRKILAELCDADLSQPWLTHQETTIAGRWAKLVRVSFAGELGWEIHSKVADTLAVFDAVWAAGQKHGLKPFGMYALDSLRLEKGYRTWKGDLSTDYSILQGGLERFVKWDKPDFRGKAALLNEKQQGVKKRFVTLVVENPGDCDAPYMSTLWHDGRIVGETTSGGWGHRVGKSIALGMLRTDLTEPGTAVEVEIFGDRFKAVVQKDEPLWDPKNERLRA
ncbi:MAG: FAD-dependent oxidoreductase [Mesorhizobium sp.]|uniref:GcvT family protein n=1 Tax=unclassified Mesorhizobium TaxID=325217 RepID=UPI000FCB7457|nr:MULTISPECIES: FAD-dependent oxidoreductase [unclassified Mesorhizobium]RUW31630.1 FAD-dependent oxidoreductase [Mesorhizobium sp. M2A.F.Ca.ET.015.02.1.1]RVC95894.1 FAD-dependent oxidoreductase [Mesorhizobium sp. M2A.F.Ca.ET.017.03.2.1]RVD01210.1 FAD-dependent oxidoreductase [Mesorhizobium sp. M2A.F.Ca.ET.029.05.1.1]RWB39005.1 MAG: FAD-dependent oxidoreductase [Mesorhizobium sp.]RWB62465.1 MAG: FAD-dependent oxidoreductase [Mesorhizobium sp.]